nr:hypothetical protein [uncultured Cohaesibacter sp.]
MTVISHLVRVKYHLLLTLALQVSAITAVGVAPAAADSCWWHNGSLMRLVAQGNNRWFYYERPKAGLAVGPGTLLFDGVKQGNWYNGTARVFSKYCPDSPMPYHVEGPVSANQLRVTVEGSREVQRRCVPTGRWTTDRLVFTYSHQC